MINELESNFLKAQKKISAARAELAAHIAHTGLTCEQWAVLRKSSEALFTMTAIADGCGILRPSVSRIVARLAELKLVSFGDDKNDTRRVLVKVTAKGQKVLSKCR